MRQKENYLSISDAELIEELDKKYAPVQNRPAKFGVTATEYAKAHAPMGFGAAKEFLEQLVASGKLKFTEMKYNGHKGRVYHK
jgi:hypothetical protein